MGKRKEKKKSWATYTSMKNRREEIVRLFWYRGERKEIPLVNMLTWFRVPLVSFFFLLRLTMPKGWLFLWTNSETYFPSHRDAYISSMFRNNVNEWRNGFFTSFDSLTRSHAGWLWKLGLNREQGKKGKERVVAPASILFPPNESKNGICVFAFNESDVCKYRHKHFCHRHHHACRIKLEKRFSICLWLMEVRRKSRSNIRTVPPIEFPLKSLGKCFSNSSCFHINSVTVPLMDLRCDVQSRIRLVKRKFTEECVFISRLHQR